MTTTEIYSKANSGYKACTETSNTPGYAIKVKAITKQIDALTTKYNRKRIYNRAQYIYNNSECTLSQAWIQSWAKAKDLVLKNRIELERLNDLLLNLFTPKKYEQTNEAEMISINNAMIKAHSNGTNLNTLKQS